MMGRDSKEIAVDNNIQSGKSRRRPVSFKSIQYKEADRTFFIKDKFRKIQTFFSRSWNDLYHSLWMTFSFDHLDYHDFKKIILPFITSGATFVIGEYATNGLSRYYTNSEDYDFVFKFMLGTAILGLSASHRITEHRLKSRAQITAAMSSEVLAIAYLYSSTFRGSRMLLDGRMPDSYSLITSLATSGLFVPGSMSYLAQKLQDKLTRNLYNKGSQRSDTALISGGLTPVANKYFQANHFLMTEMATVSRLFQLALISYNILNANSAVQQFRNLPALIADAGPPITKKLIAQDEKIEQDYELNTALQRQLMFTENQPRLVGVPRYRLRTGDLVHCDDKFDLSSTPVSGELVSLQTDEKGEMTLIQQLRKFSVNLKAHNGEDVWIEHKTRPFQSSEFKKIDLHAIRDGKQAGILTGSKLNLYGEKNFFVSIKDQKERTFSSGYEKKAIINQIITEHKRRNVLLSIVSSLTLAAFLQKDISTIPSHAIRLLFNLFQMTIPFSETFLREMVNSRLLREINQNLADHPIETIDAMRVVDLCNALGGYYQTKFPKGVAIVSDKTGTLTTSKMDVLGMWTSEMKADVHGLLREEKSFLLPDKQQQLTCLEVFINAFTNNKKELEPEEHAILQMFNQITRQDDFFNVDILGNNHFRKTFVIQDQAKTIETFHLGLYRSMGGRLTLVADGDKYYLTFCGVPRGDKFQNTSLLNSYNSMQVRTGVLSRDWCIARTEISHSQFMELQHYFAEENKQAIEQYFVDNLHLLQNLHHYCTFIIDNPVKKAAEKFISQCKDIRVPVFIATGDTAKAAENIAKVLCPLNSQKIITIRATEPDSLQKRDIPSDATVIFVGINQELLLFFRQLMEAPAAHRPVIIFSEMSTEGKGILARYLRDNGFFVVANGDGSNDVSMMSCANFVIAHMTEDGTYAPGVGQFADLSDTQLQKLFNSQQSFYELFDIHQPQSLFTSTFTPLANSQEKPSMALVLKSSKMAFELAQSVGLPVKEMWQQHWFSVGFDLIWLLISFNEINQSTDLPADNKNLVESNFTTKCMAATFAIATLQSMVTYATSGESTNIKWMMLMLSFLPFILKSIFSSYGQVQDELHPVIEEVPDEKAPAPSKSRFGFFRSCFRKRNNKKLEDSKSELILAKKP